MASLVTKIKRKFSKKNQGEDRRKSDSERPENDGNKLEEPGPSCSTKEAKPRNKESKSETEREARSSTRGDHPYGNECPRNEKEMSKGKDGKRSNGISMDSEPALESPDCGEDCKNEQDLKANSTSSLGSAKNTRREAISEESLENSACENDSSDESLGSGIKDELQLSSQDDTATSASNNVSQQDNELAKQLQGTEIINAKDKMDGQQQQHPEKAVINMHSNSAVMNSAERENPGDETEAREPEEHSLQVHAQEQAEQKVEPLVSDILSKKELEDRVCLKLDQGSIVLSNWENLACELNAPPNVKAQCRRATKESPTELLFDSFKSWRQTQNLTVNQLIKLLREMRRNDAVEVIENAIPVHKRESKVINEISDNQELLEELGMKLDKDSRVLKNWRYLGFKLDVKKEILQEIGNGNCPNAVEELFEYIYSTMPGLTVEEFKEKMKKIKRMDVLDLFTGNESGTMKEVIPLHSDLTCSICYTLNKSSPALKNWRHLASELGVDYNIYKSFEPDPSPSPSSILLEWAGSEGFTIRMICSKLMKIKRFDVIELLEKEFKQNFRQPCLL